MIRTKILLGVNRLFKAPVHPFNLQSAGKKTYAQWQFEKGEETIELFLRKYSLEEMFEDKIVVDIGCGAAGKSLYYASNGAKKVIGIEILEKYREQAQELAESLGLADKFEFVSADAAALPFKDNFADTIIINDAMEHVDEPEAVLMEVLRILKPGGRAYINIPPYHHPFGAHLHDVIFIPWVHLFFSEKVMIDAYKKLVADKPDAEKRIDFRISKREDGTEYFSYINKMTVKRFGKILKKLNIKCAYYYHEPLRPMFKPVANLRFFREFFLKMIVCVVEKR